MKKNTIINHSKTGIGVVALLLFASSCSSLRQAYQQPEEVTSITNDLFREQYRSADSASIATLSWKELFQDDKL